MFVCRAGRVREEVERRQQTTDWSPSEVMTVNTALVLCTANGRAAEGGGPNRAATGPFPFRSPSRELRSHGLCPCRMAGAEVTEQSGPLVRSGHP